MPMYVCGVDPTVQNLMTFLLFQTILSMTQQLRQMKQGIEPATHQVQDDFPAKLILLLLLTLVLSSGTPRCWQSQCKKILR